ncbi:hypothetical protein PG994_003498 [Apiospora phragmitis]|uniref:FHA domain-containing protein n=1 Tax=Apiospora phragmitis TaxID=2905665 RepID=A0ABR1VY77_9PEZI
MNTTIDPPSVDATTAWPTVSSPDIICYLIPTSLIARQCVALLGNGPHAVSRDVIEGVKEDDNSATHAIALRLSSRLQDPLQGFKFGRHPTRCDIAFGGKAVEKDPLVGLEHFRIFLDESGTLVLQDNSAYGTMVDRTLLLPSDGRLTSEACNARNSRPLKDGSQILVDLSPLRSVLSFTVRFHPKRTDEHAELYESNLRAYQNRSLAALAIENAKIKKVPYDTKV